LLANRQSEIVSVYLHAFQAMDDAGWPSLNEILDADARLTLGDRSAEKTENAGG
jgi:hypothetical protein